MTMKSRTLKEGAVARPKFVEALSRGLDVLAPFSQGLWSGNQDIARITDCQSPPCRG